MLGMTTIFLFTAVGGCCQGTVNRSVRLHHACIGTYYRWHGWKKKKCWSPDIYVHRWQYRTDPIHLGATRNFFLRSHRKWSCVSGNGLVGSKITFTSPIHHCLSVLKANTLSFPFFCYLAGVSLSNFRISAIYADMGKIRENKGKSQR